MIVFLPGPHGERLQPNEEKEILAALDEGSLAWRVNSHYNTFTHFYSHSEYDTATFLRELKYLIDSRVHKVDVIGGIHTDPYGHTTGLIGQYSDFGEYMPAMVKDTYIRFKVNLNPSHMRALRAFDTFSVFHFLMTPPHIVQLTLSPRFPVYMGPVKSDLVPSSRYKGVAISFVQTGSSRSSLSTRTMS